MDLTVVWAVIIAFAVFAYVVMDGFDLGIGILFPTFGVGAMRDQAMNAIAPVWDGNENVARDGRRRLAGGISARLLDHLAGDLSADDRDAAQASSFAVLPSSFDGETLIIGRSGMSLSA